MRYYAAMGYAHVPILLVPTDAIRDIHDTSCFRGGRRLGIVVALFISADGSFPAFRLLSNNGPCRLIGCTTGGMNTKLHVVTDRNGRPLSFFMTADQVSDYTRGVALLDSLPKAQCLLADRGYDGDWFRDAPHARRIKSCTQGPKSRARSVSYDKRRYKRRNRIEIMFRQA